MAAPQETNDQMGLMMSDFNTRLRDTIERNRLIRERVLLLGKNFISSRGELEDKINELRKDNQIIKKDLEKLKKTSNNLIIDFNKFVKRDEMVLIERMLKDFEPLKFMRKKDVEALIDERLKNANPKKELKTEDS
ncbi:MAG: hypothetical protein IH845_02540 [Nanoarchaeota archaeon]|nr:hypothetical protein [Nanoarchaeota archaeon]